jgi:hypothetical protein
VSLDRSLSGSVACHSVRDAPRNDVCFPFHVKMHSLGASVLDISSSVVS